MKNSNIIRYREMQRLTSPDMAKRLVIDDLLVTVDGEETFVILSIERYAALLNPPVRVTGNLIVLRNPDGSTKVVSADADGNPMPW